MGMLMAPMAPLTWRHRFSSDADIVRLTNARIIIIIIIIKHYSITPPPFTVKHFNFTAL